MTPNEYQELAGRTCLPSYIKLTTIVPNKQHMLHAHLGMSSEVGEVGDALKKHFVYGQNMDYTNIVEECGDVMWYVSLMLEACGTSMEDCMKQNIDKLRIRYPEKFTEELASKRLDKL